jgi:hypothetical protein
MRTRSRNKLLKEIKLLNWKKLLVQLHRNRQLVERRNDILFRLAGDRLVATNISKKENMQLDRREVSQLAGRDVQIDCGRRSI